MVSTHLRIMSVMSDVLNCACILVRVGYSKKTGFHCFIFHRKPLHWDGLGLGLGLECSGLVNITARSSIIFHVAYVLIGDATKPGTTEPGTSKPGTSKGTIASRQRSTRAYNPPKPLFCLLLFRRLDCWVSPI